MSWGCLPCPESKVNFIAGVGGHGLCCNGRFCIEKLRYLQDLKMGSRGVCVCVSISCSCPVGLEVILSGQAFQ